MLRSWLNRVSLILTQTSGSLRRQQKRRWPCRPRLEPLEARLVLFDHTWSHGTCLLNCTNGWADESNWSNGSPYGDPDPLGAVVIFPEDAGSDWDGNFVDGIGELPVKSLFYHRGGFTTYQNSGYPLLLSQDIITDLGAANTVIPDIQFTSDFPNDVHQIQVNDTGELHLDGNLTSGAGAFIEKFGTGTLVLDGNDQDYLGTIGVHQGTLTINGPLPIGAPFGALDAGATLQINTDTGLSIQGTIQGTINGHGQDATLSLFGSQVDFENTISLDRALFVEGGSHGSNLTIQGNVFFEDGSSFESDIRGSGANQFDHLTVTGTVDLSQARTSLIVTGGVNSAEGDTFTIIHAGGGIVGTFAGLPDGAVFRGADHRLYRINYNSTDVVLTHLPQFLPPAYYPLGQTVNFNTAHTIVAGDLNGDGIPDLVVTRSSRAVSILLGNGDGTFQAQTPIVLPMAAIAVTAGHFHDPHILDLAVTVSDPVAGGFVDILLGNGDGTFQAPVSYAVGEAPYDVEAGDLNGDGFDDLVTFNVGDNNLSLLYNNGDGTFQIPQNFSFPNYRIGAFTLGAVNNDGLLDILVGNNAGFQGSDSVISVLTNQGNDANGHAIFRHDPVDDYHTNSGISSLAVGDFNNDGIPDVLWIDEGDGRVGVYQGSAVGGFQGMPIFSPILGPSGTSTGALAIGDFDGDGNLDLTMILDGRTEVMMYGKGDGTFGPASSYTVNPDDASRLHALVAADFNGDGATDLAALTISGSTSFGTIAILLNAGTGSPPAPHPSHRPPRPRRASIDPALLGAADAMNHHDMTGTGLAADDRRATFSLPAGSDDASVLVTRIELDDGSVPAFALTQPNERLDKAVLHEPGFDLRLAPEMKEFDDTWING